jgi:type II secretory pathway pseudopilin PulG
MRPERGTQRSRQAFTLFELVITMAFFAGLSVVAMLALNGALRIWGRAGSRDDATRTVDRAWTALRRDLARARLADDTLQIATSPPRSLANAKDGDAVCALSPVQPVSGELVNKRDGTAYMMRNVIYYMVVPATHTQCAGGADADGYETRCPHKTLLRRVLDYGVPTSGDGKSASEETLDPGWENLLTRPTDLVSGRADLQVIATNMLTFRCKVAGSALEVDLRATAVQEARAKLAIGAVDLLDSPYTVKQVTTVTPNN